MGNLHIDLKYVLSVEIPSKLLNSARSESRATPSRYINHKISESIDKLLASLINTRAEFYPILTPNAWV